MSRSSREIKARFSSEKQISTDPDPRCVAASVVLIERDESGVEKDGEPSKVLVNVEFGELQCGVEYRFFGQWKDRGKYGWQFQCDFYVADSPATHDAVVAYLQQCRGLGSVRAGKLFDLYGESCIDRLINSPEGVASQVKGFKLEDARRAANSLKAIEGTRKTKLELIDLFHNKGFPRKLTTQLMDEFGCEAATRVRRQPYLLLKYRGCGFAKVDRLYLDLGHNPKRLKRQVACAWNALSRGREDDTWFHYGQAISAIRDNVSGVDDIRVDKAIKAGVKVGLFRVRTEAMGVRWIAEAKKADQEERVARLLATAHEELRQNPESLAWPDLAELNVSDHQRDALRNALRGFVCNLAGSPGTGKTHCTAELIKLIIDKVGVDECAACAPAGKAAVRMSAALDKCGIPLRATTTHSLLKFEPSSDGNSFYFSESRPLPFKHIFADESSMKDVVMYGCLLAARARGAHILFVGDINQLSPVGHGAPQRDSILAGIPTGTLTEIRRNSGRIVQACGEIRDKRRFTSSPKIDLDNGENLFLIARDAAEEQIETLKATVKKFGSGDKYDPIWDVQVVCAVNKKTSPLSRGVLNKLLRDQLNPHGKTAGNDSFRTGDKVICLKNGWYKPPKGVALGDVQLNKKGEMYIANGEQGEVCSVKDTSFVVRLQNPDRLAMVHRTNGDQNAENFSDPNSGSDNDDESTSTGCNWDLGYAISVHKSQGSEWPVVIVMLDDSGAAKMVCSRNWLYTAISRAKVLGLLIGTEATAQAMCQRDGLKRKTFLAELIRERLDEVEAKYQPAWTDEVFEELLMGVA